MYNTPVEIEILERKGDERLDERPVGRGGGTTRVTFSRRVSYTPFSIWERAVSNFFVSEHLSEVPRGETLRYVARSPAASAGPGFAYPSNLIDCE